MIDPTIKLFPADKNYILKEAQADLKDELLESATSKILASYRIFHNSLGLIDDFIEEIDNYNFKSNPVLERMYKAIAGYYRYRNADNQLEFLFDGRSHYNKFSLDWKNAFLGWIDEFCLNYNFLKTLIGATVLYPGANGEVILESRLRNYLNKFFNLKIYKYKGIREINAA